MPGEFASLIRTNDDFLSGGNFARHAHLPAGIALNSGPILSGVGRLYGPQLMYASMITSISTFVPCSPRTWNGLCAVNTLVTLHFSPDHHPLWLGVIRRHTARHPQQTYLPNAVCVSHCTTTATSLPDGNEQPPEDGSGSMPRAVRETVCSPCVFFDAASVSSITNTRAVEWLCRNNHPPNTLDLRVFTTLCELPNSTLSASIVKGPMLFPLSLRRIGDRFLSNAQIKKSVSSTQLQQPLHDSELPAKRAQKDDESLLHFSLPDLLVRRGATQQKQQQQQDIVFCPMLERIGDFFLNGIRCVTSSDDGEDPDNNVGVDAVQGKQGGGRMERGRPSNLQAHTIRVDLHACLHLVSIGSMFLSDVQDLHSVSLPPSITSMGSNFVFKSTICGVVDLSPLPHLCSLGDHFFSGTTITKTGRCAIDLRACSKLTSIPQNFLYWSAGVETVDLPLSIDQIKRGFLCCASLSGPSGFTLSCSASSCGEFLASIETDCMRGLKASRIHVDLSRCEKLREISDYTLSGAEHVERVILPSSVVSIGAEFLARAKCRFVAVDLHLCTQLSTIRRDFLRDARGIQFVHLQFTVRSLGSNFLRGSHFDRGFVSPSFLSRQGREDVSEAVTPLLESTDNVKVEPTAEGSLRTTASSYAYSSSSIPQLLIGSDGGPAPLLCEVEIGFLEGVQGLVTPVDLRGCRHLPYTPPDGLSFDNNPHVKPPSLWPSKCTGV